MVDENRYYVADNADAIIEYPAKTIHTPSRTILDGENECIKALPEYETAHDHMVFRLCPAIAEAAIEAWRVKRDFVDILKGTTQNG